MIRAFRHTIMAAALATTSGAPLLAQRLQPLAAHARFSTADPDGLRIGTTNADALPRTPINTLGGVGAGIVGGGVGLIAGFFAGAALGGSCALEDCNLVSAAVGGVVGESIGLALGTHYGSRGHGSLALTAATSTAIGVAGLLASGSREPAAPVVLTLLPLLQLGVTLAMER